MPSPDLIELSAQIDSQNTDAFGRFYLYATLLNKVSRRDRKKSFFDTMPQYSGTLGYTPIKAGVLDATFNQKVINYQAQFDVKVPSFILGMQRICLAFIRRGQLSDLLFIIDKMAANLNAEPMALQEYNKGIHDKTYFTLTGEQRKPGLQKLLASAQNLAHLAQDSVDNAAYGYLTIIAAVLAVKITMFLGGLALTLAMLAISGYAAYHFLQTAIVCIDRLDAAAIDCKRIGDALYEQQANNVMTPNNLNFIVNSVVFPIRYANLTVQEQTAPDMAHFQRVQAARDVVDREYEELNKPLFG